MSSTGLGRRSHSSNGSYDSSADSVSAHPTHTSRALRSETTKRLFEEIEASTDELERERLRHEVVMLNMNVAESIASRYRDRGLETDDLVQVAYMGLVKSARGFSLEHGKDFLQYAVPTVTGEVKRYFRDCGWQVRPPRRVQELQSAIIKVSNSLGQSLGRAPKPSEIATELGVDLEQVIEGLAAFGCFRPNSLDVLVGEGDAVTLGDLLGVDDPDLARAEAREALRPAMASLSERDRRIVHLRFDLGWTQERIAQDIGVTQMQVSRLLARILTVLRKQIAA